MLGARKTNEILGKILADMGLVSAANILDAMNICAQDGTRLGETCLRLGLIDEKSLTGAVARQYGLETFDLEDAQVDEEAVGIIPAEMLHRGKIAPIRDAGGIVVVTSEPADILVLDDVCRLLGERLGAAPRVAVASAGDVKRCLAGGAASMKFLKEASDGLAGAGFGGREDESPVITIGKMASDPSPVVRLVDSVLYDAILKNVSDIHLETGGEGLSVKYRIDGALKRVMEPVDRNIASNVISRIKVISELDISERRVPQDGRFKVRLDGKSIDFRVSIMPSIFGEDAVIRILDKGRFTKEQSELRLESLGFKGGILQNFRRMIREPYGMVLVTGPTGSGKTTTLYAALSEINTGDDKIITIEDPVEYQLKGVVQIAVNEKKGLTFARGLRSILRHDPDKVMVGEIRDPETAQIAIQAALTGHLVFTTVHANNVFDVIGRFIHMGIEPYNFVNALNCVAAQRLVRLICPECKSPAEVSDQTLLDGGIDPHRHRGAVFYEGRGCAECHGTGYKGRKAVVELLDLTDDIRDMISSKEPLSAIKKKAAGDGMLTLRQAAVESALMGETTLKEINRITFAEL